MGKQRLATLVIGVGSVGILVGAVLGDPDLRLALISAAIMLALTAWHFRRFGIGKLIVIVVLTYVAVATSLYDVGSGPAAWDRGETGADLIGIWLVAASAGAVIIGVIWSYFGERPAGSKGLWSFLFGKGPGGDNATPAHTGIVVDGGASPPAGWWLASDGRWYPPEDGPGA